MYCPWILVLQDSFLHFWNLIACQETLVESESTICGKNNIERMSFWHFIPFPVNRAENSITHAVWSRWVWFGRSVDKTLISCFIGGFSSSKANVIDHCSPAFRLGPIRVLRVANIVPEPHACVLIFLATPSICKKANTSTKLTVRNASCDCILLWPCQLTSRSVGSIPRRTGT